VYRRAFFIRGIQLRGRMSHCESVHIEETFYAERTEYAVALQMMTWYRRATEIKGDVRG
jgi:uncharacterized protein YhbP (UPF0306 family)